MMNYPAGIPQYFANWTGYVPPFQPHEPIPYAQAEASQAFVTFVFDALGRAVSFDKWRVTAAPCEPAMLAGRPLPAGKIFLAVHPIGDGPGGLLTLDDTREIEEYYRGHVHPDGEIVELEHVRRQRSIHHEYDYWEDGQIREWRFDAGGERGRYEYDRAGYKVNSSIERSEK